MTTNSILQKLTLFAVLSIFANMTSAQNFYGDGLKVLNPNMGNWTKVAGKFETVSMTITPAGCFSNIELVFEISAQGTNLAVSNDSLEAEYKFSLPEGSIIHHAALWMNNVPVKAQLYERSKAKFIYEALVSRRIDPLILYQNTQNTYEARVYPIINPDKRRLQISYLVPNTITAKGIEVPMDLRMFRSDMPAVTPTINIRVANNTLLGIPHYTGNMQVTTIGSYDYFSLPANNNNMFVNNAIYFATPPNKQFFITQAENANEGYYQYMVLPQTTNHMAKNVYVVDYRSVNYIDYSSLMTVLKNKIKFSLSANDSFNVVYVNNGGIYRLSQNWISGNDSIIENVFASLPANLNSNASYFFQAGSDAISFLNTHGQQGSILFLSNAGSFSNNASLLNQLISNTTFLMNQNYPVSVFDFNDNFSNGLWNGNEYFYNNAYYFYNLSIITGGNYFDLLTDTYDYYYNARSSFTSAFSQAVKSLKKYHTYDAVTFTGNSILHSDYLVNNKVLIPLGEAYMETGRYINPPTNLQMTYYYGIDSTNAVENFTVSNTIAPDTFTSKIWAAQFLSDMIGNNGQGQFTHLIVNTSIQYDVLCEYTALLALEPDTVGTVTNENPLGTNDVVEHENTGMSAVPNPFSTQQTIVISLTGSMMNQEWKLQVVDALGQVIKSDRGKTGSAAQLRLDWFGESDLSLPQGVYFITVQIGQWRKTIKVIRQ